MKGFNKILVIVEQNQQEQPALIRATQMRYSAATEIMLFTNIYDSSIESSFILDPDNLDAVKRSMIDYHTKKLERLTAQHAIDNVKFTIKVVWQDVGYLSELRLIDTYNPELVIKSCHSQSHFAQWLFSSSSSQLLKSCPCPILFVRNEFLNARGCVLTSLDPGHKLSKSSQLDNNVLRAGSRLANSLSMPMHACHVFDPSYWEVLLQAIKTADVWTDVFPANADSDNRHVIDELQQQHYDLFTDACEEMVPHVEHRHFIRGNVAEEIPELASKIQASVVVLGTTYRTGLLGSSAEKILENVEIDLMVVKPAGFKSPLRVNQ